MKLQILSTLFLFSFLYTGAQSIVAEDLRSLVNTQPTISIESATEYSDGTIYLIDDQKIFTIQNMTCMMSKNILLIEVQEKREDTIINSNFIWSDNTLEEVFIETFYTHLHLLGESEETVIMHMEIESSELLQVAGSDEEISSVNRETASQTLHTLHQRFKNLKPQKKVLKKGFRL